MKIKNCVVHGIERIEGKKKSTGEPFAFWKLHFLVPFLASQNATGEKTATCILTDEEFDEENIVLDSTCTLVTTGFDKYVFVSCDT